MPGALLALNTARSVRNGLQDKVRPVLVDYRKAMPVKLPPGHALQATLPRFETLAGLLAPGVTASFRIYAITAEGNERTSNTVTITRPL